MDTSRRYRLFAQREASGHSPIYETLAHAVAADPRLLGRLDSLPPDKRQPNLLFAAARWLDAPVADPAAFGAWADRHWDELAAVMRVRRTQTNEPGRCAVLLPVLAALPQPLALLEVGASAGLCLYPDAYRYRYGDVELGPPRSEVLLECAPSGPVPLPTRVPTVVWRAGLDLNPLDVTDAGDTRWLETLVWPEQEHRLARLRAAMAVVRAAPPRLVRGDLVADLPALAAQAPADATLVVFHSAVLPYVPADTRAAFVRLVRGLPGHWVANENPAVLPEVAAGPAPPEGGPYQFLLARDGVPLAMAGPHGQSLDWLPERERLGPSGTPGSAR
jgi:hypothetical protein